MPCKKTLFLLVFSIAVTIASAQDCQEYFPGDCPDSSSIATSDNKQMNLDNGISESGNAMKDSARKIFGNAMQRISKKENWKLMELDDYFGYGPMLAVPYDLADNKRPPVQYGVVYQFMFNADSQKIAKKWLNDYYQTSVTSFSGDSAAVSHNMKNNSLTQQQRIDSAQHYGELESQYAQANAKEFQNATLANNQGFLNQYNRKLDFYNQKINSFTQSVNEQNEQAMNPMTNDVNAQHKKKYEATFRFRNACVLQVYVECDNAVSLVPNDFISPGESISVAGTTKALLFHNSQPDLADGNVKWDYSKSSAVAEILLGPWLQQPDENGAYHPAFTTDKKNFDAVTVKKIPGNKIQTIAIHVCGRKDYVMKFIHDLNITGINSLIASVQ